MRQRRAGRKTGADAELVSPDTIHEPEGGHTVTVSGRKWWRREDAPAEKPTASTAEEGSDAIANRLAAYTAPAAAGVAADAPSETEDEPKPNAHSEHSTGEEVDSILRTAREAAASLTQGAKEQADRIRSEAKTSATRELDEAHRQAEAEREQVAKLRSDAETDAARKRSEAEAAAQKLLAEAKAEASKTTGAARAQLASVEAEATKRAADAEKEIRARVESLRAEAKRHEERLEHLLAVCRGMSSQIAAVLGVREENGRAAGAASERLDEALRPDSRSEPVG
jgi:hypothetical protein